MIAVGTVIAHRPRADPDGPNSGIRFLPRVFDGKTHFRPGVEVAWLWEPVIGQALHPFPRETIFLAPPPKRAVPEPYHIATESADTRAVRGNRVIGKVSPNDLRQPTSLLGYRLMHALAQLLLDLFEFRLHAIAPGLSLYDELTSMRLAADEDEAQRTFSGFPSPALVRLAAAWRPNSIRRVLSGCSESANSSNRARSASQKRRASASYSKPTTKSSAYLTMITSPWASHRRQRWTHRSNT